MSAIAVLLEFTLSGSHLNIVSDAAQWSGTVWPASHVWLFPGLREEFRKRLGESLIHTSITVKVMESNSSGSVKVI